MSPLNDHPFVVSSLLSLPTRGKLPKEWRKDTNCYGAVEPKNGRLIRVPGPNNSTVKMRLFFVNDILASLTLHPTDQNGNKLPRRFRLMNPMMLCKSTHKKMEHFARTTKKAVIKNCGNIALAASGSFSKKQFLNAMDGLRRLYGDDVKVTVIDGRKELHWFGDIEGDGEPFSLVTLTNHQNTTLTCEEVIRQEREFATNNSTKIWVRIDSDEIEPVLRTYNKVQTEEQLVTSIKNVSYFRLPITDHTALDVDTVLELQKLVNKIVKQVNSPDGPVHVIWTHCLGGKGRASSLSFSTHMMIRRLLSESVQETQKINFKQLTKHIWLSGGRRLDDDPDPGKLYKYNGALCRRGILEKLFAVFNENEIEEDLSLRIRALFQKYFEEHRQE